MYDVNADAWRSLESGGLQRFRHTAVLIDDIMLIFGGNSHNESTSQRSGCYSSSLIAYDTGIFRYCSVLIRKDFSLQKLDEDQRR